ncbi:hypothetical protein [Paracoccus spongiarum]|uniref:Uncharacterized protein n=1 Tax=Paracoccus spongiarum TaxID=3064387 RepID=A0ABT9JEY3_9RHOB|nr:hypothetical protein [Paracoccus sp. 2205BS29-5]MDP5308379.1 hypothetical protein [Paracoccus sp. 2205BS29-5]
MPLPHFLLMILAVVVAALLTLWASFAAGVPEMAFLLIALSAAALIHLGHRNGHDHRG